MKFSTFETVGFMSPKKNEEKLAGISKEKQLVCPFCGSEKLKKEGKTITKQGDFLYRIHCLDPNCGREFFIPVKTINFLKCEMKQLAAIRDFLQLKHIRRIKRRQIRALVQTKAFLLYQIYSNPQLLT